MEGSGVVQVLKVQTVKWQSESETWHLWLCWDSSDAATGGELE